MPPKDILSTQRARRIAVAVALGGGLALGVAGLAQAAAAPAPSGSAAPSTAPGEGRGAPREHKPHLDGTVKSISDTQILITDRSGFTRQINITAKPDGVAVGTRIHAEGTVNKDGVSLDATKVSVATERDGKRGPGGPGGPGQRGGGERPAGPKGTPPSGAPSAPAPSKSS